MKITLLGTGACEGIPSLFCGCDICNRARDKGGKDIRTRSQAAIDDSILIDLPADTYWHMAAGGQNAALYTTMLITHTHTDHFYPTELLNRKPHFAHNVAEKQVSIYGNREVVGYFDDKPCYSTAPFKMMPFLAEPYRSFSVGGYAVTPLPAIHTDIEQSLLYLIEKDGRSFLYGTDTDYFDDGILPFLKENGTVLNAVCFDCTRGLGDPDPGRHMNATDVIRLKGEMERLGVVTGDTVFVATHFSHNGGALYHELCAALNPHGIAVAYDGMEINI